MENYSWLMRGPGSLEYVELTTGKRRRKEKKIFDPSDGDPASKENDNTSKKTKKKTKEVIKDQEKLLSVDDLFKDDVFSDNNNAKGVIAKQVMDKSISKLLNNDKKIKECYVSIKRLSPSTINQYVGEEKENDPEAVDDLVNFFVPDDQDNFVKYIVPQKKVLDQKKEIFLCKQCYTLFDDQNLLKLHIESIHKIPSHKIRCPLCSILMYGSGYEVHVLSYHKEEWKKNPRLYNINPIEDLEPIITKLKPILPKITQVPSPEENLPKSLFPTKGLEVEKVNWNRYRRKSKNKEGSNEVSNPWDDILGETARNTRAFDRQIVMKVKKNVPKDIYYPGRFPEEDFDPLTLQLSTAIDKDLKKKLIFLASLDNTSFYRKYLEIAKNVRIISKRVYAHEKNSSCTCIGSPHTKCKFQRMVATLVNLKAQLIQHCANHPGPHDEHINSLIYPSNPSFSKTGPNATLTKNSDNCNLFSVQFEYPRENTQEKHQFIEVINPSSQKLKPFQEPFESFKVVVNKTQNKIDFQSPLYSVQKKQLSRRNSPSLLLNKDQNSSLLLRNNGPTQHPTLIGRVNGLKINKPTSILGDSKSLSRGMVKNSIYAGQKQHLSDVIIPSTVIKSESIDEDIAQDPLEIDISPDYCFK